MSGAHLSKDFFELIKNIGECKSKQEEEKIVTNEVAALRQRLSESPASVGQKRLKEAIVRMMYVEMLGRSADFGHIHAVNMTQQTNILSKRVGYLACSLCLNPEHEFITLLVNTIRRDLKSSNHLEVCAALIAVSKLVNPEIMPAVLECITDLLHHTHEVVRKKAVMALHRLHLVSPGCLSSMTNKLRQVLCDKDPAVMGASLHILHVLITEQPGSFKDLVPSFVSILKQITEHRLPTSFDYHRVPAPWIQIKLLNVLASLGHADQRSSEHMYEVLYDVLKRADTGINIGYAVVYECVRTITAIYPNVQLMETAANHISRFVSSENHNLKYLGIKSLASIVQVNQKYALEHQLVVVECMEDNDETLKRKTLDLIFKMTNAANVVFVVDKLVLQLRQTTDVHFRTALVDRITQLAERYAPDNAWFITTMNYVFELGGDVVQVDTAHNLLRLIAEGGGENEEADLELRLHAVNAYHTLLAKPHIPDVLMRVVCWSLGEYAYISPEFELHDLVEMLCDVMERQFSDSETRCWVMSAITKLCAQLSSVPEQALETASKYVNSQSISLQQYCAEFLALAAEHTAMEDVLPVDASCEDLEVDEALSFLDAFVDEARRNGAAPYMRPEDRPDEMQVGPGPGQPPMVAGGGLRFDEYANPKESVAAITNAAPSELLAREGPGGGQPGATGLNTAGVAKRWGMEGYSDSGPSSATPPAPTAPAASTSHPTPPSQPTKGPSPPSQEPAPMAAARPAELTEKEKLAAKLFSGMGPSARAVAAEVSAKSSPAPPTPATAQPAKVAKEKKAKKKDKRAGDTVGDAAAGAGSAGVGDLLGDLLDLDTPGPVSAAPNAPQSAVPPQGPAELMDLLSISAPGPPGPAETPTLPAATAPALMPAAMPPPVVPAATVPSGPAEPSLGSPSSARRAGEKLVAEDDGLRISTVVVLRDDGVRMDLRFTNKTHAPLQGVTLHVEPPAQLRAQFGGLPSGAEVRGGRVVMPQLHGGQSRDVQLTLACADAPTASMRVPGFVSYIHQVRADDLRLPPRMLTRPVETAQDRMGQQEQCNLSFHLTVQTVELIRPRQSTTQEFGQLWGEQAHQRKFTVATKSISSPSKYMEVRGRDTGGMRGASAPHRLASLPTGCGGQAAARSSASHRGGVHHVRPHPGHRLHGPRARQGRDHLGVVGGDHRALQGSSNKRQSATSLHAGVDVLVVRPRESTTACVCARSSWGPLRAPGRHAALVDWRAQVATFSTETWHVGLQVVNLMTNCARSPLCGT